MPRFTNIAKHLLENTPYNKICGAYMPIFEKIVDSDTKFLWQQLSKDKTQSEVSEVYMNVQSLRYFEDTSDNIAEFCNGLKQPSDKDIFEWLFYRQEYLKIFDQILIESKGELGLWTTARAVWLRAKMQDVSNIIIVFENHMAAKQSSG